MCPGPAATSKKYLKFLCGLKNMIVTVLDKLNLFVKIFVFLFKEKGVFQKQDFAEFTISELIKKIWEIMDALKNNYRTRYLFWLPSCKGWCEEYLKEKWKPSCMPNLKFILERTDEQNLMYWPGAYV